MEDKQQSIKASISLSGKGLHSGKNATVNFKPAPDNFGICFKRMDLNNQPLIPAFINHVRSTNRGVVLEKNSATIKSTEHLMAAVYGLQIDNLLIEMDNEEVPILDGSAFLYAQSLRKAGIIEQEEDRVYIEITDPIKYSSPASKSSYVITPAKHFQIEIEIQYFHPLIKKQSAILEKPSKFMEQIAQNRTFVFLEELEHLMKNGLIKGGSLDNALVFSDKNISQKKLDELAKLLDKPKIKKANSYLINQTDLYFKNEPARHKLLDLIGDLSLIGRYFKGKVFAFMPGHESNIEFAKHIIKQLTE